MLSKKIIWKKLNLKIWKNGKLIFISKQIFHKKKTSSKYLEMKGHQRRIQTKEQFYKI